MNKKTVTKNNEQEFSKFLSFILRHKPEEIGVSLEDNGWINIDKLIKAINNHEASKWVIDLDILEQIVANDNKQRYSFNDNKTKIRANQGHSIKELVMNFKEVETPPEYLYHGTSKKNFEMIKEACGLLPMSRQMVHLSGDIETASKVGKRHGDLIVLQINTCRLLDLNHKIYISDNGVYLVDSVPLSCIESNI